MILVLAESALELVPRELWGHPAVVADARRRGKRPGELLLDRARHHPAMSHLTDAARRGRPDIVHQVLLVFQYSLLNRRGLGRVYVHTRDDHVISIRPETRVPKNYNNFVSLKISATRFCTFFDTPTLLAVSKTSAPMRSCRSSSPKNWGACLMVARPSHCIK